MLQRQVRQFTNPASRNWNGLPTTCLFAVTYWMLEELRVSLFAQTLGTQGPVSENRILAALSRLRP